MKKFILLGLLLLTRTSFADETYYDYRNQTELGAKDYMFKLRPYENDPVFEKFRGVDLGVNLGIGSDCGRVDFKSTLQATLKNILDNQYFSDIGKDIIAGSPMLLACYFSPTWCAILKHSQINANFMSQMRLNQCALMDKYTDSRVQDFYEERQACVHKEIDGNGGNIEAAMQTCNNGRVWDSNLANWSGSKYGDTAGTNKLIASSAHWAGLDTDPNSNTVKLVQSLVGDTVITHGNVSVEYGDKPFGITPRLHLAGIQRDVQDKLCSGLMKQIDEAGPKGAVAVIRGADIKSITGSDDLSLLDAQTIRNLSVMPYRTRSVYCARLADSVAVARFSEDMNRSLDVLSVASQNPNLPDSRRLQVEQKRMWLKQSVESTIQLQSQRNAPLNEVVAQINQEGDALHRDLSARRLQDEADQYDSDSAKQNFFDCSDGVLCNSNQAH
jgi:hypothetical protein